MAAEHSVEVCRQLQDVIREARVHRPMRITRYDAGQELVYDVTQVGGTGGGQVRLLVEKFVGGGFAGQVYKVRVTDVVVRAASDEGRELGLQPGRVYAMKIFIPPSNFARLFRNILYWIGLQGAFALQVNPAAARAGALWQKFIRRGAKIRFGDENATADVYATFVDGALGSCGELIQWIDGRTWRLEVDDRLDLLSRWRRGKTVDRPGLGSPEYRAKREFMRKFVDLLHDMGWHEFARQYEWSTAKSQPNCLKRSDTEDNPSAGLVAVDFRAGLVLLPFLPMSPGDFKLIAKGIMRGSLVQFDRGDISKLEAFVQAHSSQFADMQEMLDELKSAEQIYRSSLADITHNHVRLFYSGQLWSTIFDSAVTGWKVRNLVDENWQRRLRTNRILTLAFFLIGLIPFLGKLVRRIWARPDWRKHYAAMLTSCGYLRRAIRARMAEKAIVWHRAGRVDGERSLRVAGSLWRFLCHLPLSVLPAGLHRFLTDSKFAKERLARIFVRPIRLYFDEQLRERWLREMVAEGQKKHILSEEDAQVILSQLNEPFIQKYLVSLVVHLMTLPVSEIVWVIVALAYVAMHPGLTFREAYLAAGAILLAFQFTPISPGSLIRGVYVWYLVIRERNFRDYNIAAFLSFFKLVGYLAFPIQMAYRYPALARFMAGHWATEAVHIVPVFGEHGALLEHGVFYLFYNWPLTIRRRMRKRAEFRAVMKPRYWHVGICTVTAAAVFGFADFAYITNLEKLPSLKDIWWLMVLLPVAMGAAVTLGCGGAALGKRIIAAAVCGVSAALLYSAISWILSHSMAVVAGNILISAGWRIFIFAVLATIGAIATELKLPEPGSE
jgi:hypothetical protein